MSVYAPMLGAIWRILESYGIEPRDVIPEKHYRPGRKFLYADRVSFREYDTIQARAASLVKDPAMGIRMGLLIHPSHLGALGYAWMASSTLRTALNRGRRFGRMFNEHVDITLEDRPGGIRATYGMSRQPTRPNLVGDGQIAGLLSLCRSSFGSQLTPARVTLKRQKPADPGPWLEYFGENVSFGQENNSLMISSADADSPLTTSNPEMIRLHEDVIERYLMRMDRDSVLNRARLHIMEQLPSGRVTEDDTARALAVSKRTLHRKLRENGETFRSVLAQVRMNLARRYIEIEDYSVTEIAFLLGYTDTSAFSRAFRSWFGRSPTQARSQLDAA